MADLSPTVADVAAADTATTTHGIAGGTITALMPLYVDAADSGHLKPADANASVATAAAVGIALHASLDGQPIRYITAGELTVGATLVVGDRYVVSPTAGGIRNDDERATGDYRTDLGYAKDAATLVVGVLATGVLTP